MGSKVDAPAVPDYTPIANANAEVADKAFQISQEQLDWAKEQYAQISPYAFDYLQAQQKALDTNQAFADSQIQRYQGEYAPIESALVQKVNEYQTPARADQDAGMAMADAGRAVDAQRSAALTSLQSYGIDPSTTRYGALDASYRIAKAAAEAASGTQSRRQTEATGLGLMSEAINIGRGYPGAVAQTYATATTAGGAGLKAADTNYAVGADAMGSPTGYLNASTTARGQQAQALNLGYSNALSGQQLEAQSAASNLQGIGNIIGGIGRTAVGLKGMDLFG